MRAFAIGMAVSAFHFITAASTAWALPAIDPQKSSNAAPTAAAKKVALHSKPQPKSQPQAFSPTLHASIDLSAQRMTVSAGGVTLHSWKISSGRTGHETPTGRFRPNWTAKMWHSRKYNMAPMPYSVFFNGGIATHGTGAVNRLGGPASHGCIRLRTANARAFYKLVHQHGLKRTRIVVTGRAVQRSYKVASATPANDVVVRPTSRRSSFRNMLESQPDSGFSMMSANR